MSLHSAQPYYDHLFPNFNTSGPYSCLDLDPWLGCPFWMEPSDPRLVAIHNGEPAPTPPLENLEGMIHYWTENPEWMDYLDPQSPVHQDKMLERGLYLNFWGEYINQKQRVLDIGGGVGRLAQVCLEQDSEVQVIDPDLRSLWRNLSHSVGQKGAIDLHWATVETMPELGLFDLVLACEVFNYIEDPEVGIRRIHQSLKSKGILLFSVEARWGWAMARDVVAGSLDAFLETGIVHIPHDRWIRTFSKESIEELLSDFTILAIQPSHYSLSGPFEMIVEDLSLEELLKSEEKLRNHPVSGNLNRAWMVVAQKN